eukprot:CAMPEP_0185781202 /NCGR_PEP_ID=MMETSP1174-20130828/101514_1 /TAXON_ID=35687 /ORGANISM="Dictyocha speculum, Strain CCMP1381" /LENGTH=572 /DNA_ID=CAMNT_0028471083 /DNA_START=24 /DNA_END=1742 /DNA_ORIENTATION=-
MEGAVLYYDGAQPISAAVLICIAEMGSDCRLQRVDTTVLEEMKPHISSVTPVRELPVLVTSRSRVISNPLAIVAHLRSACGESARSATANARKWYRWASFVWQKVLLSLRLELVVTPTLLAAFDQDPAKVRAALGCEGLSKKGRDIMVSVMRYAGDGSQDTIRAGAASELDKIVAELETHFASTNSLYLSGECPGDADAFALPIIVVAVQLSQWDESANNHKFARVEAWRDRLLARPAYSSVCRELALLQDFQRPSDLETVHPEHGMDLTIVQGMAYPPFLRASVVEELINSFQSKSGDIFICTFAKCGTTWMQQIVLLLLYGGDSSKVDPHPKLQSQAPWLEACYCRSVRWGGPCPYLDGPRLEGAFKPMHHVDTSNRARRVFKTHATRDLFPVHPSRRDPGTRTIIVGRNPKDTACSLYNHSLKITPFRYSGPWEHFLDCFLNGKVEEGRWDKYYSEWYQKAQEEPESFLFIHFEKLKRDPFTEMAKIARFIGVDPTQELLEKVVSESSFAKMKKAAENSGDKSAVATSRFRQGGAGKWHVDQKGLFTNEQSAKMDETFSLPEGLEFDEL